MNYLIAISLLAAFPMDKMGQTVLMETPSGEISEVVQSDDLTQIAMSIYSYDDSMMRVIVNGQEKGSYASVWDLKFTKDGNLAYVALDEENKMYFVLGSKTYGPYDYVGEYILSEDGQHYAFRIGKGGKWNESGYYSGGKYAVFHDGKLGKEYEFISLLALSPEGSEVSYVAHKGGKWSEDGAYNGGKMFVVRGGVEDKKYDWVSELIYSPDGKHLAYIAGSNGKMVDWQYVGGERVVIVDAKASKKKYPFVINLVFDSSGTACYIAGRDGSWSANNNYVGGTFFAVTGAGEGKKHDLVKGLIATKSGTLAYIAGEDGRWEEDQYIGGDYFIVQGKRKIGPYNYIDLPVVAKQGDYYACVVSTGGRWDPTGYYSGGKYSVVPSIGIPSKQYDDISGQTLILGDKEGFAFLAYEGGEWYEGSYEGGKVFGVCNQKESGRYNNIFPMSLNISPDGRHFSMTAQNPENSKEFIVVDGQPLEGENDFVFDRMLLSEDGKYLAYNSVVENKVYLNVVEVAKALKKEKPQEPDKSKGGKGHK
ncbi:MAG: hypothetical protein ACP5QG_01400 [candidate division WOR-3 bacterium]